MARTHTQAKCKNERKTGIIKSVHENENTFSDYMLRLADRNQPG